MSTQRVRAFLLQHAPDLTVTELQQPIATVSQAAEAFGVESGQIAKSLSCQIDDQVVMLVITGDKRLDNRKYKDFFGVKAKLVPTKDVASLTGFPPGGVCPFGVDAGVRIYCDVSLTRYDDVLLAGGDLFSGVRIAPARLAIITGATWVDLSR
ncbi:YbaK/EbsC family protein [Aeromonas jandaei]